MIFHEFHDAPECYLALVATVCLILGYIEVKTCTIQSATMHVTHSDTA